MCTLTMYACDNKRCMTITVMMTGLWPSDFSGDYPCGCSNETFDVKQVQSLVPTLNKYWPSYNRTNQVSHRGQIQ